MSQLFDASIPQYIEAADAIDLTGVDNWTLGVWVKSADWSVTGNPMVAFGRCDFVGSDHWQWYFQIGTGGIVEAVYVTSPSNFVLLDSVSPLSTNAWHLLIMRFGEHDAQGALNLDLWIDGSVVDADIGGNNAASCTAPMRIGAFGSGSVDGALNGLVSRPFAFVGTTLTDAQCSALLTTNPTGATFWAIGSVNELVDYGGFTTLTNHGSTFSADDPLAQVSVPVSDVSAGNWTPSTGSDFFAMVDETTPNDSDYITSGATPVLDSVKLQLSPIQPPDLGTVTLRIRAKKL